MDKPRWLKEKGYLHLFHYIRIRFNSDLLVKEITSKSISKVMLLSINSSSLIEIQKGNDTLPAKENIPLSAKNITSCQNSKERPCIISESHGLISIWLLI
jgi:hypothetical protein